MAASRPLRIALDAMGADRGPEPLVAGALRAAALHPDVELVLVGDRAVLDALTGDVRLEIVHSPDVVPMSGSPIAALRAHPDASLPQAIAGLRDGAFDAVVSCGNSGAVVVEAVRRLGLIPGVERVALGVEIPRTDGGVLRMLDVGATVDARPEHVFGHVALGRAWAQASGESVTRVGVLSNGEERTKGNRLVQAVLERFGSEVVPVEPGPALAGAVDVLVTDGFVGNVVLKAIEAAASAARGSLGSSGGSGYGGAVLLGVPAVVLVGHGSSGAGAVASAIDHAVRVCQDGVLAELAATASD